MDYFEIVISVGRADGFFSAILFILVMGIAGLALVFNWVCSRGEIILALGSIAGLYLKLLVDKVWRAIRD